MKNAIILHGRPDKEEYEDPNIPSPANSHWIPWLKQELENRSFNVDSPDVPFAYEANYDIWKSTFEKCSIGNETILIGHSCGGGFLVRWLSENKVNVGQVVLVAPWTDPTKELTTRMFDFTIDPELVSRTSGLAVMYSLDDDDDILKTVDELKAALPQAIFKEFSDKGHFTLEDMGTNEFPEILEVLGV